jgi:hypothetical protein
MDGLLSSWRKKEIEVRRLGFDLLEQRSQGVDCEVAGVR